MWGRPRTNSPPAVGAVLAGAFESIRDVDAAINSLKNLRSSLQDKALERPITRDSEINELRKQNSALLHRVKQLENIVSVKQETGDANDKPHSESFKRRSISNGERLWKGHSEKRELAPSSETPFPSPAIAAPPNFDLMKCTDERCKLITYAQGEHVKLKNSIPIFVSLRWRLPPQVALLVKKPNDPMTTNALLKAAAFLRGCGVEVVAEPAAVEELREVVGDEHEAVSVLPWDGRAESVDFVVSLGGDGTILWVSGLFPNGVPPVVSFSLGSLGFLTPFPIGEMERTLRRVIDGGFELTLRSRLEATVRRGLGARVGSFALDSRDLDDTTSHKIVRTVLNEISVDRGPNAHLAMIELLILGDSGDTYVTTVQGDGIIIATPTGSTAYSLAAGGSMLHPSVPAMAVTPICPHSLSFRPILVPDGLTLKLRVANASRSSAFLSFDGRQRIELKQSDFVTIRFAEFPVPAICQANENVDWFTAIRQGLHWNVRENQKAFGGEAAIFGNASENAYGIDGDDAPVSVRRSIST